MTTQADFNLKSIISQLSTGGPESRASSEVSGSTGADFDEMFRSHSEHLSELAAFAANPESGKSGNDSAWLEVEITDEDHSETAFGSSFELQTLSLSNGRQVLTSRLDLSRDAFARAWYSELGEELSFESPGSGQDMEWLESFRDSIASQVIQGDSNYGTSLQASSTVRALSATHNSGVTAEGTLSWPDRVIPNDTVGPHEIDDTEELPSRISVEGLGVLNRQLHHAQGNPVSAPEASSAVSSLSLSTRIATLKSRAEGNVPGEGGSEFVDMTATDKEQVDVRRMLDVRSEGMRDKPGEQIQQSIPQSVLRSVENRKMQDMGAAGLEYKTAEVGKDDRRQNRESLFSNVENRPQENSQSVYDYQAGSSSTQSTDSVAAATADHQASAQAAEESLTRGEQSATRSEVLSATRDVSYRFTDARAFVREVPEFVAEIMREAGDKGEKHIRIRLFPENLGRIDATISETNEGLRVQLIAETAHIAKLLRDSNSVLRDMLTNGDEMQFQVDVASEQQAGNAFTGSDDRDQANSTIAADEDAKNTITSNRVSVSSIRGLDTYV